MTEFIQIHNKLEGLWKRFGRLLMVETLLWVCCGVSGMLCLALVLAQFNAPGLGAVVLLVSVLGAVFVWITVVLRSLRALRHTYDLTTARLAEGLAPELGSAPSSALELTRQMKEEKVPFSKELAEEHIRWTAEILNKTPLHHRLAQSRRHRKHWAIGAALGASLLALITSLALGEGRRRLALLVLEPGAAQLSDVPLAGDIRITYRYPAYTGRSPRTVEGGDGSLSAVVGTEVSLQATADIPTRHALLRLAERSEQEYQDIPMQVTDGRKLEASLSILRDGRYHFALIDQGGERLEERGQHAIRALPDAHPEVHLDEPSSDVELKDDQIVHILWRARDDFGISEVNLVVEPDGSDKEAVRIPLSSPAEASNRREGRYRWSVAELGLEPGSGARFYIEASDNDTIGGPKRGVSSTRRLVLFSAKGNHEKLLERQRKALDSLVDWLGEELVAPFEASPLSSSSAPENALRVQQELVEHMSTAANIVVRLIADLRNDRLSGPEITAAFENILDHINEARRTRATLLNKARRNASQSAFAKLSTNQSQTITVLEKDIIYLDDLLALQRIEQLKENAKDLLAAQRDLSELLTRYQETKDPNLRDELEQRIRELRQKMLETMAKMNRIKETLPGEWRNIESSSMLELGDQLDRLEKMLREDDLEGAARELEQIANQLEQMVDGINEAEEEYGGERYAEVKKQLAEFAQSFRELESQQRALAERTDELLKEYRKRSIEQVGRDLEDFVRRARAQTAKALKQLDVLLETDRPSSTDSRIESVRQRLIDLDALLEHRDFAEAREVVEKALRNENNLLHRDLDPRRRFGTKRDAWQEAREVGLRIKEHTENVQKLLDKLFPKPSEVLSPEEQERMQRMSRKQQKLEEQSRELGEKMDRLSEEMPLFGGEPRNSLDSAQQEMGQAAQSIESGQLPRAAGHERRAVQQLGKLREALEQASQKGGAGRGMPLPLGGMKQGRRGKHPDGNNQEVEIPQVDPNRGLPGFRQDLLEAAKQKAPKHYEDAVQRYYRELIR